MGAVLTVPAAVRRISNSASIHVQRKLKVLSLLPGTELCRLGEAEAAVA
jgi:hypothetical protein